MSNVEYGYLETTFPWALQSHFFPSKVGGKPAWLALKNLPTSEELQCGLCKKPLIFLCQVYAPVEEIPECFHRTIFLFVCRNPKCSVPNENKNFAVWRNQLPRENEFYSSSPPVESETNTFDIGKFLKPCSLCGCPSDKHCGKCKIASYCSREHQIVDWKERHKEICCTKDSKNDFMSKLLFFEFDLKIGGEDDEESSEDDDNDDEESEQKRLNDFKKLVEEGKAGTMNDVSEDDLELHAGVTEDQTFVNFRKQLGKNQDAVLRYNLSGEPLWIASDPKPAEIPPCEYCKSERQFEFQILPQLLFSLREHNIDWGILAVYTCKNNCTNGPTYKNEFIFRQDVKAN